MNTNIGTKNYMSLLCKRWINISKRQRESRKKYRNNKRDMIEENMASN